MSKAKGRRGKPQQEIKRRKEFGIEPEEGNIMLMLLIDSMRDASVRLGIPLDRDIQTVKERYKKEGFGFISKTLPMFQDWLRSCLAAERLWPCPVFKSYYTIKGGQKKYSPFPSFLKGLVMYLADEDGNVYSSSHDPALQELRTEILTTINMFCTSFGKKYEVPLPSDKVDKQILNWFKDDDDVFKIVDAPPLQEDSLFAETLRNARRLIEGVFFPYEAYEVDRVTEKHTQVIREFRMDKLNASHGSGATSYRLANHEKYTRSIGLPLHYCGTDDFATYLALPAKDRESCLWLPQTKGDRERLLSWLQGGISKVAIVPKNSKKGRIICMEPIENMMVQQGLRKLLYEWIESNPITSGFVNFRDQGINGALALAASRSAFRATLDLKAASDSVSRDLVWLLFPDHVFEWLDSCRSRFARANVGIYKGGKKVGNKWIKRKLNKFAPMGSALCFPIEALCFWALAKGALQALKADSTDVWVYGDDLILPAEYTKEITDLFSKVGLTINSEKSFSTGYFRESCGVDAYQGFDTSPSVRCSTRLPGFGKKNVKNRKRRDANLAKSITAWVEYANEFEADGFPTVSKRIRRMMAGRWPSSRSFPRLSTPYDAGFLYFLDYERGRPVSEIGRKERKDGETAEVYNYTPTFPYPARGHWRTRQHELNSTTRQGELFSLTNNYLGRRFRGWVLENGSEPQDLNENERLLRYFMEGASQTRSDEFVSRENLRLVRKGVVVS